VLDHERVCACRSCQDTHDPHEVLLEDFKHDIQKTGTEGESPLDAAKRELLEETGYGEGEWEESMVICGNASTTNNFTHSFIAKGVKKVSTQHLDRTEDIEPVLMNVEQVKELLYSDSVKQALMAAPLWKFFAKEGLL